MAAGNAARFGENKLAATVNGKPLIEHALDAIPRESFSRVLVVTQHENVEAAAKKFGFETLRNEHPERGQSETIRPGTFGLIKLAAQDKDVTRIFVNPAIKQQLCLDAGTDRDWLRKVRPWFQHRAHMHVRLRCPADSLECEDQPLPPPGDGCGAELQSWFEPPKPGTTKPEKKTPPPLPPSCQALLDEHVI